MTYEGPLSCYDTLLMFFLKKALRPSFFFSLFGLMDFLYDPAGNLVALVSEAKVMKIENTVIVRGGRYLESKCNYLLTGSLNEN